MSQAQIVMHYIRGDFSFNKAQRYLNLINGDTRLLSLVMCDPAF